MPPKRRARVEPHTRDQRRDRGYDDAVFDALDADGGSYGGDDSYEYDGFSDEALSSSSEFDEEDFLEVASSSFAGGTADHNRNRPNNGVAPRRGKAHRSHDHTGHDHSGCADGCHHDHSNVTELRLRPMTPLTCDLRNGASVENQNDREAAVKRTVPGDMQLRLTRLGLELGDAPSGRSRPSSREPEQPPYWRCVVYVEFTPMGGPAERLWGCSHGDGNAATAVALAELTPSKMHCSLSCTLPPGCQWALFARGVDAQNEPVVVSASMRLHLHGEYTPKPHHTNLAVAHRWYTLRPEVTKARLILPDGSNAYAPPGTVVELHRRDDDLMILADGRDHVGHSHDGMKTSGQTKREKRLLRRSDRVIAVADDWAVFSRRLTPLRSNRICRVRRYPHRDADVVATIPFGTIVTSIGETRDSVTGDVYAVLPTDGVNGYARLRGDEGLFLCDVPHSSDSRTELVPSLWMCSTQRSQGIRVFDTLPPKDGRNHAPWSAPDNVAAVAPNEVKEAVAIHVSDGVEYVQWATGGYSRLRSDVGVHIFVSLTPFDQPLRSLPRRSHAPRGSGDDAIVDLDELHHSDPQRPQHAHQADASPQQRKVVDIADDDPTLARVRELLGTITFRQYPRVVLPERRKSAFGNNAHTLFGNPHCDSDDGSTDTRSSDESTSSSSGSTDSKDDEDSGYSDD